MLNENRKNIIIGAVICVLFMVACYWAYSGKYIPDNRNGIEYIAGELKSATNTEREIAKRIKSAENRTAGIQERIGRSEEGIRDAQKRADGIEGNLNGTGELIAECQRILENIRDRRERKTKVN